MNPNTPKPRGRPQKRPTKELILATLATAPFMTAPAVARTIGMHRRVVREHLRLLELNGECFRISDAMPVYWSLTPPARDKDGEPCDPFMKVKQSIKPVGTWQIDHAVPQASVFQLGVA